MSSNCTSFSVLLGATGAWLLMAATLPPLPPATPSLSALTETNLGDTNMPSSPTNIVITFAPDKIAVIQQSNDLSNWFDFTNGVSPIVLPLSATNGFFRAWYLGDVLHASWGTMPTQFTQADRVGLWVPTDWKCVWSSTNLAATNAVLVVTNSLPNGLEIFIAGVGQGTNWWPFTRASSNYFTLAGVPGIGLRLTITNQ